MEVLLYTQFEQIMKYSGNRLEWRIIGCFFSFIEEKDA